MGVVVGETCRDRRRTSTLYQGVTLGGTGKQRGEAPPHARK